jgi:hypothetical protein
VRRLLWVGAWFAVAVWSLIAFAAYGLIDAAGSVAMRNADVFSTDPATVEWIWQVFSWLRGLSTSIALVIWGVISLAILSVPWLIDRVVGRTVIVRSATTSSSPFSGQRTRPVEEGVIDLAPDQYSVGPAPNGGQSGPVPRITPRH